ncbi:hypothetical protein GHT09_007212 [Marmota monax]|uniref:Cytosol aminopeptidase domain-containing protein n=1 Tax=Marmota monax TaxID=9995 RepID=A0A834V3R1_MARMO|nr:hypothetical protein GHT09_007212 [Marmota monax]
MGAFGEGAGVCAPCWLETNKGSGQHSIRPLPGAAAGLQVVTPDSYCLALPFFPPGPHWHIQTSLPWKICVSEGSSGSRPSWAIASDLRGAKGPAVDKNPPPTGALDTGSMWTLPSTLFAVSCRPQEGMCLSESHEINNDVVTQPTEQPRKPHTHPEDRGSGDAPMSALVEQVASHQGFKDNLHAVFCLAENSVGPNATRPDDIHLLYSGKTVEINNTDAEGRLVLADGVSYACKDLGADIILDMATLTGAQGIATGKYHAAVLTNSAEWEAACVKAGRKCGDLVHPLVYCPELHFSEFTSAVADMKNSVADRDNSPSSCAGLFIASHIGFDWPGVWVHLDIAAPVHAGERATGFGVALLLALFGGASEDPLLNLVSPLGCEAETQEGTVGRDSKRRRLV